MIFRFDFKALRRIDGDLLCALRDVRTEPKSVVYWR
jgi:hypothetical protein